MKLILKKSENLDDWYTIELAEHENKYWSEPTEYGSTLMYSGRISDACVEGSAAEMLAIADAIDQHKRVSFKRCAVNYNYNNVEFYSPRNSKKPGSCSHAEASELATKIRLVVLAAKIQLANPELKPIDK